MEAIVGHGWPPRPVQRNGRIEVDSMKTMIRTKFRENCIGRLDPARIPRLDCKRHERKNDLLMLTDPHDERSAVGLELFGSRMIEQKIVQAAIDQQACARKASRPIGLSRDLLQRRAPFRKIEHGERALVELRPRTSGGETVAENDEMWLEEAAKPLGHQEMRRTTNAPVAQKKHDCGPQSERKGAREQTKIHMIDPLDRPTELQSPRLGPPLKLSLDYASVRAEKPNIARWRNTPEGWVAAAGPNIASRARIRMHVRNSLECSRRANSFRIPRYE